MIIYGLWACKRCNESFLCGRPGRKPSYCKACQKVVERARFRRYDKANRYSERRYKEQKKKK